MTDVCSVVTRVSGADEPITDCVKSHVTGAEFQRSVGFELDYTLPLAEIQKFAGLCRWKPRSQGLPEFLRLSVLNFFACFGQVACSAMFCDILELRRPRRLRLFCFISLGEFLFWDRLSLFKGCFFLPRSIPAARAAESRAEHPKLRSFHDNTWGGFLGHRWGRRSRRRQQGGRRCGRTQWEKSYYYLKFANIYAIAKRLIFQIAISIHHIWNRKLYTRRQHGFVVFIVVFRTVCVIFRCSREVSALWMD